MKQYGQLGTWWRSRPKQFDRAMFTGFSLGIPLLLVLALLDHFFLLSDVVRCLSVIVVVALSICVTRDVFLNARRANFVPLVVGILLLLLPLSLAVRSGGGTVYVTVAAHKYHRLGCESLKYSCRPIKLNDAEKQGYTACRVCHPAQEDDFHEQQFR